MDRRTLLKSIAVLGAGLLLPPTVAENAEAARRYWSLDRTMLTTPDPDCWLSGPFDTSGAWSIIPIGGRAYWDDGRIEDYPLEVLPDDRWRIVIPREGHEVGSFQLSVRYHKQHDPEGSLMTMFTSNYGGLF